MDAVAVVLVLLVALAVGGVVVGVALTAIGPFVRGFSPAERRQRRAAAEEARADYLARVTRRHDEQPSRRRQRDDD